MVSKYVVYMPTIPKIKLEDIAHIEETAITVRGYRRRTTVPSKIFKFMGLKEGDILRWIAMKDGTVMLVKVKSSEKK